MSPLKSSQKGSKKTTNIEVIDNYYEKINNSDEVERLIFINEFQRLFKQIEIHWKAQSFIPEYEKKFVRRMLEREVYEMKS